jgi:hypothetical protein
MYEPLLDVILAPFIKPLPPPISYCSCQYEKFKFKISDFFNAYNFLFYHFLSLSLSLSPRSLPSTSKVDSRFLDFWCGFGLKVEGRFLDFLCEFGLEVEERE